MQYEVGSRCEHGIFTCGCGRSRKASFQETLSREAYDGLDNAEHVYGHIHHHLHGHVLDYGCGYGRFSRLLLSAGHRVTCCDRSELRRDWLREHLTGATVIPPIPIVTGKP